MDPFHAEKHSKHPGKRRDLLKPGQVRHFQFAVRKQLLAESGSSDYMTRFLRMIRVYT